MKDFFQDLPPTAPLRQGDIIASRERHEQVLFVATADCDIAQDKHGGVLTCLRIIPARDYLDRWATARVQRFIDTAATLAAKSIQDADSARDPSVERLSTDSLNAWLQEDGVDGIVGALTFRDKKERRRCTDALAYYHRLSTETPEGLPRLRTAWDQMGKTSEKRRSELRDALSNMKEDYFFLPHLPTRAEMGFVACLREPMLIPFSSVFLSEADARIRGGETPAYVRLGRYADYIRFAIVQQFAYLFARIGMISVFESDRDFAIDLILSEGVLSEQAD